MTNWCAELARYCDEKSIDKASEAFLGAARQKDALKIGQFFRHYGGEVYRVVLLSRREKDLRLLVSYQTYDSFNLYGSFGLPVNEVFTRPWNEFLAKFTGVSCAEAYDFWMEAKSKKEFDATPPPVDGEQKGMT